MYLRNLWGYWKSSLLTPTTFPLLTVRALVSNFSMNATPRAGCDNQAEWQHLSPIHDCLVTVWCKYWVCPPVVIGTGMKCPHSLSPLVPYSFQSMMRCSSQKALLKSSSAYRVTATHIVERSPKGVQKHTFTNKLFWRLWTKKWVCRSGAIKIMRICTVRCHFQLHQILWPVREGLGEETKRQICWESQVSQSATSHLSFFSITPRRKQK